MSRVSDSESRIHWVQQFIEYPDGAPAPNHRTLADWPPDGFLTVGLVFMEVTPGPFRAISATLPIRDASRQYAHLDPAGSY